jgi:hypothetical protein
MLSVSRPVRRLATTLTSIGLAALVATGSVMAGTPVSVGWKDHAYAGGATRPSSDKPQSKLWYTDEGGGNVQWWGGLFRAGGINDFQIYKFTAPSTWTPTGVAVDRRDGSHGDYLWDEDTNTLYVASAPNPNNTDPFAVPTTPDDVRIFKYTYNPATDTYTSIFGNAPKSIAGTASTAAPAFRGGAWTVSIDKDSSGRLWAVWPKNTSVMYSTSTDDGVTWSAAAQMPGQGTNTIKSGTLSQSDTATVIGFGNGSKTTIGVAWSDQDGSETAPGVSGNGYWFATIAAGADPAVEGNWTRTKLPAPAGLSTIYADNHINIKSTSDGTLYMVGKARTDTINCATLKERLLTPFYRRTTAGAWSVRLAGTAGDCETRPQVVISEQLDTAYLFLTSPNGGGAIYRKAAPLSGPDAFDFRGGGNTGDTLVKRGVTFIRSTTETLIDDPSTTKQVVTNASGIAVIANNLPSASNPTNKWYLHNYMSLPASDNADPTGTITINNNAATTDKTAVTLSVPGSDAGSGMALVRISNSSSEDGNGVLNGPGSTSYTYTSSIAWTLTSDIGTKTVYAQWRDAAGNWSTPVSDTIQLVDDLTPPTPPSSVKTTFAGSGSFGFPVRVVWTAGADNAGGSGLKEYRVDRSSNGGAYATVGTVPASQLFFDNPLPNSVATYRYRVTAIDNANNASVPRYGTTFKTVSYNESNTALKYSSTWALSTSPVYIGGKARHTGTANRSVSLTFTGSRIAWLGRTTPQSGSAKVYINGALMATVNLNSATPVDRKLVWSKAFGSVATRTLKIVVVGTAGHPDVILDQIFVLR